MMDIKTLAKEQEAYIIECRRWLHAHPELSTKEVETTRFIKEQLEKNGISVQTFEDITGCIATIQGGKPGKTVMLRADIDALPIQENPGKSYCSLNPGVMHACGHDCHTAMLLGAARILQEHREELKGTVKLIFQMAEEIGRKSEEYVTRGALEGVDAIFGMHVWSALDKGKANFESGGRMACSDRFTIQIHGKAAHGSAPHQGQDAILAAAAAVMALQSLPSRVVNPLDSLVVSVGMMNGGTKENILCGHVELVGTVRAFDREFRNSVPQRIQELVTNVVKGYGCSAECDYYRSRGSKPSVSKCSQKDHGRGLSCLPESNDGCRGFQCLHGAYPRCLWLPGFQRSRRRYGVHPSPSRLRCGRIHALEWNWHLRPICSRLFRRKSLNIPKDRQ